MATNEEKHNLIDTIKRPIRHYRIRLLGYGAEYVWGESTQEEYSFWQNTENCYKEMDLDPDEHANPFEVYMFEKNDTDFDFVPEAIRREGDWYDQDDIEHINGPTFDSAFIEIVELDTEDYNSDEIETIVDNTELYNFVEDKEIENVWGEVEVKDYMFEAVSSSKGCFFEGRLTTNGKIDLTKLQFDITEAPNGDEIVVGINYKLNNDDQIGEPIDNDGGDTREKGFYVSIVKGV